MNQILEKYEAPVCINKDVILPVPSNQKTNNYLKEIAGLSGITAYSLKQFVKYIAKEFLNLVKAEKVGGRAN